MLISCGDTAQSMCGFDFSICKNQVCENQISHDMTPIYILFPVFQVRVPTHEDGSCLFWEFATDYYDIGFGVYFEWTIAPSNTVSVHVSESSDEEDLDEEGEWWAGQGGGGDRRRKG